VNKTAAGLLALLCCTVGILAPARLDPRELPVRSFTAESVRRLPDRPGDGRSLQRNDRQEAVAPNHITDVILSWNTRPGRT
jgi:hypothetical protein